MLQLRTAAVGGNGAAKRSDQRPRGRAAVCQIVLLDCYR
jgi:hypothetical protein